MDVFIASTRFNNNTYAENINYRHKFDMPLIYGSDMRINRSYPRGSKLLVFEMNNTTNKIEGLGLISNYLIYEDHSIYTNGNYNRYIYMGKYWIDRASMYEYDAEIVTIVEKMLFTRKSHLKRQGGISVLTPKLVNSWSLDISKLNKRISCMFVHINKLKKLQSENDIEKKYEKYEKDTNNI